MQTTRFVACLALAACVAVSAGGCGAVTTQPATTGPTSTFSTPEDAIHAYVGGVANADANAILAASAIDQVAQGFDFVQFVSYVKSLRPLTDAGPADYPLYADVNRYQRIGQVLGQVRNLAYGLLSQDQIDPGNPVITNFDETQAQTFVKDVDPARLAGLTVEQIGVPTAISSDAQRYADNRSKQIAWLGADEITERLVLLSWSGTQWSLGFTLLRYGSGWSVYSQVSPSAGTDSLGIATQTTAAEFATQIGAP